MQTSSKRLGNFIELFSIGRMETQKAEGLLRPIENYAHQEYDVISSLFPELRNSNGLNYSAKAKISRLATAIKTENFEGNTKLLTCPSISLTTTVWVCFLGIYEEPRSNAVLMITSHVLLLRIYPTTIIILNLPPPEMRLHRNRIVHED